VKITSNLQPINGNKAQPAVRDPGAQDGSRAAQADRDTIHSCALSSLLDELEARLATDGAFDADKVESIKQAINEGRFTIDSGAIADKLMQCTQELMAGKKS
jgi:negative regulator of flagellin synthesis FlgM